MKIKVCGMRADENIAALCQLPVDHIGFIFYRKSPRYVKDAPAATIPERIKKVGVFVNASVEEIISKATDHQLDLIQLHGDETPGFCHLLKNKGFVLIKAFAADSHFDFGQLNDFEDCCDYYLLDAKGDSYGGNGLQFDWQILKNYTSEKKFFLSGGIDLESVDEVLKIDLPQLYAIDVNSKFESAPALKDISKIKRLTDRLVLEKTK